MPITTILEIIRLSLEITLKLISNMTPEQAKAFAERHERNMAFWEKVFSRFDKEDPKPATPT